MLKLPADGFDCCCFCWSYCSEPHFHSIALSLVNHPLSLSFFPCMSPSDSWSGVFGRCCLHCSRSFCLSFFLHAFSAFFFQQELGFVVLFTHAFPVAVVTIAFNALSLSSCFSLFGWCLYLLFSPNARGGKSRAAKKTVLLVLFILLHFIFCSSLTLVAPFFFSVVSWLDLHIFSIGYYFQGKIRTYSKQVRRMDVSLSTGDALLGHLLLLY